MAVTWLHGEETRSTWRLSNKIFCQKSCLSQPLEKSPGIHFIGITSQLGMRKQLYPSDEESLPLQVPSQPTAHLSCLQMNLLLPDLRRISMYLATPPKEKQCWASFLSVNRMSVWSTCSMASVNIRPFSARKGYPIGSNYKKEISSFFLRVVLEAKLFKGRLKAAGQSELSLSWEEQHSLSELITGFWGLSKA